MNRKTVGLRYDFSLSVPLLDLGRLVLQYCLPDFTVLGVKYVVSFTWVLDVYNICVLMCVRLALHRSIHDCNASSN
jgi:hypothetical protein